jgi:Copper transport outer membrane protein, MctB
MINFRFHVVSLIAIFLALALGVVIGAGVIDRGVVDALNDRINSVETNSERIKAANGRLSGENEQLEGVIGDLQPFAVSGRLVGDDIGVVAVRGVDGDRTKATVTALQEADATVTGTLWLEDKWQLANADDVKALQTVLVTSTRNKDALRAEAWRQLAERLSAPTATGVDAADDLLVVLQQAGFLGFDAVGDAGIADFPGRGAGVVLVVGNQGSVPADSVVLPAATALHGAEVPLVVAGVWADVADGPERAAVVQPLRDSDLEDTVSTVDDLDQPEGPTAVTLAMSDLFLFPPVVGHYGYGQNAQQPLPDPVNP